MEPRQALDKVRSINRALARELQALADGVQTGKLNPQWATDERIRLKAEALVKAKALADPVADGIRTTNEKVAAYDVEPTPLGAAAFARAKQNARRVVEDELRQTCKTLPDTARLGRTAVGELQRLATECDRPVMVAEVLRELELRAEAGDEVARGAAEHAARRLVELVAAEPHVQTRHARFTEQAEVGELLYHAVQSIESGEPDLGRRLEDYKQISAARAAGDRRPVVLTTAADGSTTLVLTEPAPDAA